MGAPIPPSSRTVECTSVFHVVVIHAPIALERDFIDYPHFSDLGPIQAATVLQVAGLGVTVVDAFAQPLSNLHPHRDGRFLLGVPVDVLAARLPQADAYVIGMNSFLNPLRRNEEVATLVRVIRQQTPTARIVIADCYVGGQHYIDYPAEALFDQYAIDGVCTGEAEQALLDVLLHGVRVATPLFGQVNLAQIPWPDWTLIDRTAHRRFLERIGKHGLGQFHLRPESMPLTTTRGCVYRCAFCTSAPGHDHRKRVNRARSLDAVATHVNLLKNGGARHLHVLDELANFDVDRFAGLLEVLNGSGLTYEFPNGLRADTLEERHLDLMRDRVGFFSISAESASPRVLNELIEKGLDPKHIERVASACHDRGISLAIHWQIGTPGETRTEINQTLNEALRLRKRYGAEPLVQFATPIPGTRLHRMARDSKTFSEDVRGDIGPLFQRRSVLVSSDWTPADLGVFMHNFRQRLAAEGTRKIIMNATYRCNNRCVFCATGDRVPIDGELTRQKQFLREYRERGADLADFDGGEPTLYEGLFPLIDHARALGYRRVCVTTNGRRAADPVFARRLTHCGITDLLVSLHGPDRVTHERMTDAPGSFELTVAGLRNCLRLKPRELDCGVNITVGTGNTRELPRFASFVRSMGVRKLNIQFITPFGRATAGIVPDPADVVPFVKQIIDQHGATLAVQVINLPWCYMPGYERYMASDVGKRERDMVFVTNQGVQLHEYLSAKRQKQPICAPCAYNVLCDGFYVFEETPATVTQRTA